MNFSRPRIQSTLNLEEDEHASQILEIVLPGVFGVVHDRDLGYVEFVRIEVLSRIVFYLST